MLSINTYSNNETSRFDFDKKPTCKDLKLKYCERFRNIYYNQIRLFDSDRVFLDENEILTDKDYIIYIMPNHL